MAELACFSTPSEVVELVKEAFGLELTRQQVYHYDATRPGAEGDLARRWRELHKEVRAAFLEDEDRIAIAHRNVRLRRLERFFHAAAEKGARDEAAGYLRQAAKEMGDRFTNRKLRRFVDVEGRDREVPEVAVFVAGPGDAPPPDFVDPTKDWKPPGHDDDAE